MITFFNTDITLIIIFAAGLFLGHVIGSNKRLRKENRELLAKTRSLNTKESKYATTETGR